MRVDAELRRLLHDQVHAFAARDALQQGDLQRRFTLDGVVPRHPHQHLFAVAPQQCAAYSPPAPLNKRERRAGIEAQHPREVRAGLRGQPDSLCPTTSVPGRRYASGACELDAFGGDLRQQLDLLAA